MGYSDGSHNTSVSINDVSTINHLRWDMEGHKVTGVKDPDSTEDQQAAVTVKFLNEYFLHKKMNPTISSFSNELVNVSLNMSNNRIFGLPQPLLSSDACTLFFISFHFIYYQSTLHTILHDTIRLNTSATLKLITGRNYECATNKGKEKKCYMIVYRID